MTEFSCSFHVLFDDFMFCSHQLVPCIRTAPSTWDILTLTSYWSSVLSDSITFNSFSVPLVPPPRLLVIIPFNAGILIGMVHLVWSIKKINLGKSLNVICVSQAQTLLGWITQIKSMFDKPATKHWTLCWTYSLQVFVHRLDWLMFLS